MEYVVGIIVVLVVLYQFIKASNRKGAENGRNFLAANDPSEFMKRRVATLRSPAEIDAFNYLLMRPWRETRDHFAGLLHIWDKMEAQTGEPALKEERREFLQQMGVDNLFVLATKMVPLALAVADVAPRRFSAWGDEQKAELERSSQMPVSHFFGISSRHARAALMETMRQRL